MKGNVVPYLSSYGEIESKSTKGDAVQFHLHYHVPFRLRYHVRVRVKSRRVMPCHFIYIIIY